MQKYLTNKQREKYEAALRVIEKIDTPEYEVIGDGIIVTPKTGEDGFFDYENHDIEQFGVLYSDKSKFSKFNKRPTQSYIIIPKEIDIKKTINEKLVFIGLLGARNFFAYGDYLINAINKLWIFIKKPELLNYKICFFIDSNNKIPFELLELFGIKKENLINIKEITQAKEIIIPQCSMPVFENKWSKEFDKVVEKIKENVKSKNYKKVYLSRSKLPQSMKTYGEDIIEKQFKKNGFKIIYPERYSIKEQIAILKDCEFLAGTIGSNMHNAIFCKNNIKTAYLNRTELTNIVQMTIDVMKNFNANYIDVYTYIFTSYRYGLPYLIEFNSNLKMFFKDNNFKYDKNININKELLAFIKALANNNNVKTNCFNIYNNTELSILNNFRKILKRQTYQIPLFEEMKYKFKLWYYLKTGKFSKAKKYYSKLYR